MTVHLRAASAEVGVAARVHVGNQEGILLVPPNDCKTLIIL